LESDSATQTNDKGQTPSTDSMTFFPSGTVRAGGNLCFMLPVIMTVSFLNAKSAIGPSPLSGVLDFLARGVTVPLRLVKDAVSALSSCFLSDYQAMDTFDSIELLFPILDRLGLASKFNIKMGCLKLIDGEHVHDEYFNNSLAVPRRGDYSLASSVREWHKNHSNDQSLPIVGLDVSELPEYLFLQLEHNSGEYTNATDAFEIQSNRYCPRLFFIYSNNNHWRVVGFDGDNLFLYDGNVFTKVDSMPPGVAWILCERVDSGAFDGFNRPSSSLPSAPPPLHFPSTPPPLVYPGFKGPPPLVYPAATPAFDVDDEFFNQNEEDAYDNPRNQAGNGLKIRHYNADPLYLGMKKKKKKRNAVFDLNIAVPRRILPQKLKNRNGVFAAANDFSTANNPVALRHVERKKRVATKKFSFPFPSNVFLSKNKDELIAENFVSKARKTRRSSSSIEVSSCYNELFSSLKLLATLMSDSEREASAACRRECFSLGRELGAFIVSWCGSEAFRAKENLRVAAVTNSYLTCCTLFLSNFGIISSFKSKFFCYFMGDSLERLRFSLSLYFVGVPCAVGFHPAREHTTSCMGRDSCECTLEGTLRGCQANLMFDFDFIVDLESGPSGDSCCLVIAKTIIEPLIGHPLTDIAQGCMMFSELHKSVFNGASKSSSFVSSIFSDGTMLLFSVCREVVGQVVVFCFQNHVYSSIFVGIKRFVVQASFALASEHAKLNDMMVGMPPKRKKFPAFSGNRSIGSPEAIDDAMETDNDSSGNEISDDESHYSHQKREGIPFTGSRFLGSPTGSQPAANAASPADLDAGSSVHGKLYQMDCSDGEGGRKEIFFFDEPRLIEAVPTLAGGSQATKKKDLDEEYEVLLKFNTEYQKSHYGVMDAAEKKIMHDAYIRNPEAFDIDQFISRDPPSKRPTREKKKTERDKYNDLLDHEHDEDVAYKESIARDFKHHRAQKKEEEMSGKKRKIVKKRLPNGGNSVETPLAASDPHTPESLAEYLAGPKTLSSEFLWEKVKEKWAKSTAHESLVLRPCASCEGKYAGCKFLPLEGGEFTAKMQKVLLPQRALPQEISDYYSLPTDQMKGLLVYRPAFVRIIASDSASKPSDAEPEKRGPPTMESSVPNRNGDYDDEDPYGFDGIFVDSDEEEGENLREPLNSTSESSPARHARLGTHVPAFPEKPVSFACSCRSSDCECDTVLMGICPECFVAISAGCVPEKAIANLWEFGPIPPVLSQLSYAERNLLSFARCFLTVVTVTCYGGVKTVVKGRSQTFVSDASVFTDELPNMAPSDRVVFAGPFTPEAKVPILKRYEIQKDAVLNAITWLRSNNFIYDNAELDKATLDKHVSADGRVAEMVEVAEVAVEQRDLDEMKEQSAGYDHRQEDVESLAETTSSHIVEGSVMLQQKVPETIKKDRDAVRAVFEKLKKATVYAAGDSAAPKVFEGAAKEAADVDEWIHRASTAFAKLEHAFHKIFFNLFPFGFGALTESRIYSMSLAKKCSKLLCMDDGRFTHEPMVLAVLCDLMYNQSLVTSAIQVSSREAFKYNMPNILKMGKDEVESALDGMTKKLNASKDGKSLPPKGDEKDDGASLLSSTLAAVSKKLPWSREKRFAMRQTAKSMWDQLGPPTWFITYNPSDIYNPIVFMMAGKDVNLDDTFPLRNCTTKDKAEVFANAVAKGRFVNAISKLILTIIIGMAPGTGMPERSGGLHGMPRAYLVPTESTDRGMIHLHILLWIYGGPRGDVADLNKKLRECPEYLALLQEFLLTSTTEGLELPCPECLSKGTREVLGFPDQIDFKVPSTLHCSKCGLHMAAREVLTRLFADKEMTRSSILSKNPFTIDGKEHRSDAELIRICVLEHVHTATCYKYENKTCRMGYSRATVQPYQEGLYVLNGRIGLRKKRYPGSQFQNPTADKTTVLLRCNTDAKCITIGVVAQVWPETSERVRNRIFKIWNDMKKADSDKLESHLKDDFTDDENHAFISEYVRQFGKQIESDGELTNEMRKLHHDDVIVGGSGAMSRVYYCLKYPMKVNDAAIQNAAALSLGVAKSLARHGDGGTEVANKTVKEKGLSLVLSLLGLMQSAKEIPVITAAYMVLGGPEFILSHPEKYFNVVSFVKVLFGQNMSGVLKADTDPKGRVLPTVSLHSDVEDYLCRGAAAEKCGGMYGFLLKYQVVAVPKDIDVSKSKVYSPLGEHHSHKDTRVMRRLDISPIITCNYLIPATVDPSLEKAGSKSMPASRDAEVGMEDFYFDEEENIFERTKATTTPGAAEGVDHDGNGSDAPDDADCGEYDVDEEGNLYSRSEAKQNVAAGDKVTQDAEAEEAAQAERLDAEHDTSLKPMKELLSRIPADEHFYFMALCYHKDMRRPEDLKGAFPTYRAAYEHWYLNDASNDSKSFLQNTKGRLHTDANRKLEDKLGNAVKEMDEERRKKEDPFELGYRGMIKGDKPVKVTNVQSENAAAADDNDDNDADMEGDTDLRVNGVATCMMAMQELLGYRGLNGATATPGTAFVDKAVSLLPADKLSCIAQSHFSGAKVASDAGEPAYTDVDRSRWPTLVASDEMRFMYLASLCSESAKVAAETGFCKPSSRPDLVQKISFLLNEPLLYSFHAAPTKAQLESNISKLPPFCTITEVYAAFGFDSEQYLMFFTHARRLILHFRRENADAGSPDDEKPQERLGSYLRGGAGSGKTHVTTALPLFALLWGFPHAVVCTAFTHTAVNQLHGTTLTLHSLSGSYEDKKGGLGKRAITDDERVAISKCRLIIVDEISMVPAVLYAKLTLRMQELKGKKESFGNIDILHVGDFNQIPPMFSNFLFEKQDKFRNESDATWQLRQQGHAAWKDTLRVAVTLRGNHRQQDSEFAGVLQSFVTNKQGGVPPETFMWLDASAGPNSRKSRDAATKFLTNVSQTQVIVRSNKAKMHINLTMTLHFAAAKKQPLRVYPAIVEEAKKLTAAASRDFFLASDDMTGRVPTMNVLCEGMPVTFSATVQRGVGQVNAAEGHVYKIIDDRKNQFTTIASPVPGLGLQKIMYGSHVPTVLVWFYKPNHKPFPGLPANVMPVYPYRNSNKVELKRGSSFNLKFTSLPFIPNFASTPERNQGQSKHSVIVITDGLNAAQFYTAITRVRTIEGLALLQPIPQRIRSKCGMTLQLCKAQQQWSDMETVLEDRFCQEFLVTHVHYDLMFKAYLAARGAPLPGSMPRKTGLAERVIQMESKDDSSKDDEDETDAAKPLSTAAVDKRMSELQQTLKRLAEEVDKLTAEDATLFERLVQVDQERSALLKEHKKIISQGAKEMSKDMDKEWKLVTKKHAKRVEALRKSSKKPPPTKPGNAEMPFIIKEAIANFYAIMDRMRDAVLTMSVDNFESKSRGLTENYNLMKERLALALDYQSPTRSLLNVVDMLNHLKEQQEQLKKVCLGFAAKLDDQQRFVNFEISCADFQAQVDQLTQLNFDDTLGERGRELERIFSRLSRSKSIAGGLLEPLVTRLRAATAAFEAARLQFVTNSSLPGTYFPISMDPRPLDEHRSQFLSEFRRDVMATRPGPSVVCRIQHKTFRKSHVQDLLTPGSFVGVEMMDFFFSSLPGNENNSLFHVVEANYIHDVARLEVAEHRGKRIFVDKRVIVPLNVNTNHWVTVVVNCFETPGTVNVCVFDSLGTRKYDQAMDRLLQFFKRVCQLDQDLDQAQRLRLVVRDVPNLPRQVANDCAIFAYLFASCISLQADLPFERMRFPFQSNSMDCYRTLLTDALLSRSRLLFIESIIKVEENACALTAMEASDVSRIVREAEADMSPNFLRFRVEAGGLVSIPAQGILRILGNVERGWLDDDGVNAAVRFICHVNERCIFVDSLMFSSLQEQVNSRSFRSESFMDRLTLSFATKKFILLPIHKGGNHWILATIEQRGEFVHICLYDSLDRDTSQVILQSKRNAGIEITLYYITAYVLGMHSDHVFDYSDAFPGESIQYLSCPRQENANDCGMHVILSAMCLSETVARGERSSLHFQTVDIPVYRKKLVLRFWNSREP
jgi:hypothetical protein